jgi:hypothetical protein
MTQPKNSTVSVEHLDKFARILLWIAILALIIALIPYGYRMIRAVILLWGAPELIFYEFEHSGFPALTVIVMLIILRISKTVVATLCTMFAIVGFHSILLYDWPDYIGEDLQWAGPFAIAAIALITNISLRKK